MHLNSRPELGTKNRPLREACMRDFPSLEELEIIAQDTLGIRLNQSIDIKGDYEKVAFRFVNWLEDEEKLEEFIRQTLLREKNYSAIHAFVANNIDFLLEYNFIYDYSSAQLREYRENLDNIDDFNLVVKAFKDVSRELESDLYFSIRYKIDPETDCWKDDKSPKLSRLFIILDILLNEKRDGSLIQRLCFFLKKLTVRNSIHSSEVKQKACLQIIVDDGRLPDEIIFTHAFLTFESIDSNRPQKNKDIKESINIIDCYEKEKGSKKDLTVKFTPLEGVRPILDFIRYSESEIARRIRSGTPIDPRLWIEIFLPRQRLFEKIDAWPRPVTESKSLPLSHKYKVIFCSLERLKNDSYFLDLQSAWDKLDNSTSEFVVLSKIDIDIANKYEDIDGKIGVFCPLERIDILRGDFMNIVLDIGLSRIIFVDFPKLANAQVSAAVDPKIVLESLSKEIHLKSLFKDSSELHNAVREKMKDLSLKNYFAMLYDEPTRIEHLRVLYDESQGSHVLGMESAQNVEPSKVSV